MRSVEEMRRLSALLDEALERPPSERDGWLDALPADPDGLKPALRSLLERASRETDDLLDRGPAFRPPAAGPAAGAQVGAYRLLRELGSGGMGSVWLAERADGPARRQVALKLPHAGWSPTMAERFERECGILASLEHPNIARLYDAGADAEGRPYMALEYVEGRPIDVYCRERALDLPERLRLLLQVADAVAFAHGRLVLHRDLKPANILVTADGQVRLLDFGIAKLMDDGQAAETALTRAAGRALTLDYASPEQIRGEPLGTASDVYSLGVVAFELLAGQRPYRLKRGSAAELEEAITGQDLPLASAVAQSPELRRRLKGDLDAILHKVLKKDPVERYPTIDALAADWRRHLEGRRVLARPDTAWQQLLRVATRHRVPLAAVALTTAVFVLALGFGAAAVVIAALVAGLGGALWQTRRATAERDRALALAERNAAVNVFLDTLLTRAARAGPLTAGQLLERSEALVEREIRGNAEHRAYVLGVLANCYSQLDQPARAAALLERALDAARDVADGALRDTLAGRYALARGHLGEMAAAVAATDALLARRDLTPEVRAETHSHCSVLASWRGDQAGALEHAVEALRWYRAARRLPPRQEAVLLGNLGWAHLMHAQGDEAERHLAQAMAVLERLGLDDSPQAVQLIGNWALARQEMGDLPGSLALYERGLAASAKASPDEPPSIYLVANRGYALVQAGRYDDAAAAYREGIAIAEAQNVPLIAHNIRLLRVELLADQGRLEDAERELGEADAALRREAADGGPAAFAHRLAEARLALLRGEPDAAVQVFSAMLKDETPTAGTVNALLGRAGALQQAGRAAEAEADARAALGIAERLRGRRPASFRTGLAQLALARLEGARGDAASARQRAAQALAHLQATVDAGHPALVEAHALAVPGAAAASSG